MIFGQFFSTNDDAISDKSLKALRGCSFNVLLQNGNYILQASRQIGTYKNTSEQTFRKFVKAPQAVQIDKGVKNYTSGVFSCGKKGDDGFCVGIETIFCLIL